MSQISGPAGGNVNVKACVIFIILKLEIEQKSLKKNNFSELELKSYA